MVDKCANPGCDERFYRLGAGKLFPVERRNVVGARRTEVYWLCGCCAATMHLEFGSDAAPLLVVERGREKTAAAAA
jgi:hypothetical protein